MSEVNGNFGHFFYTLKSDCMECRDEKMSIVKYGEKKGAKRQEICRNQF